MSYVTMRRAIAAGHATMPRLRHIDAAFRCRQQKATPRPTMAVICRWHTSPLMRLLPLAFATARLFRRRFASSFFFRADYFRRMAR